MSQSDTGERVTPVLDFPSRDGLSVQAIRVDYEPGGFTERAHRHPAGAYVYVIDGSVEFGVGDGTPIVLKAGESLTLKPARDEALMHLPASPVRGRRSDGAHPQSHRGEARFRARPDRRSARRSRLHRHVAPLRVGGIATSQSLGGPPR